MHIVGACSSVVFEQNPVQDSLDVLLLHSQSCRIKMRVKFNWICFGLFVCIVWFSLVSALLVLSFWCVFWNCGSSVFQCNFLVILCRAILDQVRYVPEVISEPCSTLFFIVKWILLRLSLHYGRLQFVCFRRKSSAWHLSRFALRIVLNREHWWFSTKFALDLFQCIVLLWTFSVVQGLCFCCVSEDAAFRSSNALFWLS